MMHAFLMEADASGAEETDSVLRPYAELEDPGSTSPAWPSTIATAVKGSAAR